MDKKNKDDGKICAILAYLLIGIIWYFADDNMKKNDFAKYHVKQGLNLIVISIGLGILWSFLGFTIILIPIIFIIAPILNIILFVLWIIGIINAINNKKKEVPIVGKFAKKYLSF